MRPEISTVTFMCHDCMTNLIIHNNYIYFAIFNFCFLFSIFYIARTDSDMKTKSCCAPDSKMRQHSLASIFFTELNRKVCELHWRFNPFHASNLFLYPLKISEKNRRFLIISRGIERDQWHKMG